MLVLLLMKLATAAPFVTTWNITNASETIVLPPLRVQSNLTVDWGDSGSDSFLPGSMVINHTYVLPGLYNVSMTGQTFWGIATGLTTKAKLVDVVSWGDGLLVDASSPQMFANYPNLRVSAPSNTQPVFLAGASLSKMFASTTSSTRASSLT